MVVIASLDLLLLPHGEIGFALANLFIAIVGRASSSLPPVVHDLGCGTICGNKVGPSVFPANKELFAV